MELVDFFVGPTMCAMKTPHQLTDHELCGMIVGGNVRKLGLNAKPAFWYIRSDPVFTEEALLDPKIPPLATKITINVIFNP